LHSDTVAAALASQRTVWTNDGFGNERDESKGVLWALLISSTGGQLSSLSHT